MHCLLSSLFYPDGFICIFSVFFVSRMLTVMSVLCFWISLRRYINLRVLRGISYFMRERKNNYYVQRKIRISSFSSLFFICFASAIGALRVPRSLIEPYTYKFQIYTFHVNSYFNITNGIRWISMLHSMLRYPFRLQTLSRFVTAIYGRQSFTSSGQLTDTRLADT